MTKPLRHVAAQTSQGEAKDAGYVAAYLALLSKLREAADAAELRFVALNETRPLLHFRQAFFLQKRSGRWRVACISSLPVFDRNAPMVRHIEAEANKTLRTPDHRQFDLAGLEDTIDANGARNPFSRALFLPLPARNGECDAGLLWPSRTPLAPGRNAVDRRGVPRPSRTPGMLFNRPAGDCGLGLPSAAFSPLPRCSSQHVCSFRCQ